MLEFNNESYTRRNRKRRRTKQLAAVCTELYPQMFGGIIEGVERVRDDMHSVHETLDQIQSFTKQVKRSLQMTDNDTLLESILSRIESLLILFVDLSRRETLRDMLLPMLAYIKTWSPNTSLVAKFGKLLTKILTSDSDGQEVELTGQSGWFTNNWQLLTEGQFGKRLASAINLMIMVGICPSDVQGSMTDEVFKILHVQASRKRHPTIFHHLFVTMDWVIDAVIPAIQTGNYSLLLYDSDYADVDELFKQAVHAVQLNIAECMDECEKLYGISDEAELMVFLTNVSQAHHAVKTKLSANSTDPYTVNMKRELQQRLIKLDKLIVDIQSHWHEAGLRAKPYAVFIRGPSSIGKSTLAGIVVHAISQTMNFPEGPEYCVTLNGSDKYQSEFRSRHVCVIFDDMGNTKPQFAEGNPLFILIQFINNMHCSALSPEAEKKGKMDIRSKIVIVTSNTEDLHAKHFSVNPASIMRRFDLVLDASLRKSAMNESGGLHSKFAGVSQPDAWQIDIKRVQIIRNHQNNLKDSFQTPLIASTDVVGLIDYLMENVPAFYAAQDAIVASSTSLHEKEHCPLHKGFILPCPKCLRGLPMDQILMQHEESNRERSVADTLQLGTCQVIEESSEDENDDEGIDPQAGEVMFERPCASAVADNFVRHYLPPLNPEFMDKDAFAEAPVAQVGEEDWVNCKSPLERIADIAGEACVSLREISHDARKAVEKDPKLQILAGIAALGLSALAVHSIFAPKRINPEGAVFARIQESARVPRAFVKKDDVYQKVYTNKYDSPLASVSSTMSQLESKIDKNLYMYVVQEYDVNLDCVVGKLKWANAFPVGGCRWMTVGHEFESGKTYKVDFQLHPGMGIKRFTALVNDDNITRLSDCDGCILHLPEGGDTVDFSKYMFETMDDVRVADKAKIFVYHVHESMARGKPEDFQPPSNYKLVAEVEGFNVRKVVGIGTFEMLTYKAPNHPGFCGSMVFLAGRNPVLIGFHSAGRPETHDCAVTLLTQDMLSPAEDVVIAESSELPENVMGRDVKIGPDVHPFHPVHWIDDDEHAFEAYGQHDQPTAKFRSDIIESPMLPLMKKELNYEPMHTPPPKKSARPSRRKHLMKVTQVLPPSNPSYLKAAKLDFKTKLKPVVSNANFREYVHPLDYRDAVNGVDGVKGYDPINPNTAMGFPLRGPKSGYMVRSGLEEELGLKTSKRVSEIIDASGKKQYVYEIVFKDEVQIDEQIDGTLALFLRGERVNMLLKCNLKNAVISWEKTADGIRVFAGAPVYIVIICRMLTLPLINMMTYFPDVFESAVGVNAKGKDWQELFKMMTHFNNHRVGDGDFSSFDTLIRPVFTKGGFDMIHWMLKECGFSEELLKMFDGLATECIYPVYESDGFVYKALGSNPSGHPLTVVINGLVNSLYMRYAYYAMHKKRFGEIPLFHTRVALMTYGDDNTFNVHEDEELFNMQTVGEQLARIGVKYTDASKNISAVPFKHAGELSFLKRTFKYHSTLKSFVGPLEIKSILRSLAYCNKPKDNVCVAAVCAQNLEMALDELYLHGEEKYDEYLPIFRKLADGAIDAEGNKVADWYSPPSKEVISQRFNDTTCCYDEARLKLERQSGELPMVRVARFTDQDIEEMQFLILVLAAKRNGKQTHVNGVYNYGQWVIDRIDALYMLFTDEIAPGNELQGFEIEKNWIGFPPIKDCKDVDFRFFATRLPYYCLVGPLIENDYRIYRIVRQEIFDEAAEMKHRRTQKKGIAQAIKYLHDNCFGVNYTPTMQDRAVLRIYRLIMLRGIDFGVPPELRDQVRSFLDGPVLAGNFGTWHTNMDPAQVVHHMHAWNRVELGAQAMAELGHFYN